MLPVSQRYAASGSGMNGHYEISGQDHSATGMSDRNPSSTTSFDRYLADQLQSAATHASASNGSPSAPSILVEPVRRPSPWHEIAHSLSTTSLPTSRRPSIPPTPTSTSGTPRQIPQSDETIGSSTPLSWLSRSQSLRDWEARLQNPENPVHRHALLASPPGYPDASPVSAGHKKEYGFASQNGSSTTKASMDQPYGNGPSTWISVGGPAGVGGNNARESAPAKLAAERDKEGHIEYKLKLIDPSPERFERLVTQMMWRLKQGKNEAIYELGLADDGTVVGLTRAEMDASLLTLEHMASEVGGTVLVLKEIVLEARHRNIPLSKCARSGLDAKDADNAAMLGEGTSSWGRGGKKYRSKRRDLRRSAWFDQKMRENARGEAGSHSPQTLREEYGDYALDLTESAEPNDASRLYPSTTSSEPSGEGTPFQLELEPGPNSTVIPVVSPPGSRWRSKRPSARRETPEQRAEREAKSEEKLRKRAEKREERRMSLLRGDGHGVGVEPTTLQSTSLHSSSTASISGASESSSQQDLQDIQDVTHRLSSLRLPPPLAHSAHDTRIIEEGLSSTQHDRRTGIDADSDPDFFGELLHTPLDSLSLSFADVRTVRAATDSAGSDSEPPSPDDWADISGPPDAIHGVGAKSPEIQNGNHGTDGGYDSAERRSVSTMATAIHSDDQSNPELELICVEALVVRKPLFERVGYGLAPDEDEVEWGGEEDGWGLGGNDVWGSQ